jgi:hypothetical protein
MHDNSNEPSKMRICAFAYLDNEGAALAGLPETDTGYGLILMRDQFGVRLTRAGDPVRLNELLAGRGRPEDVDAFPHIRLGHPDDWASAESA